jgi:hypothetical protein
VASCIATHTSAHHPNGRQAFKKKIYIIITGTGVSDMYWIGIQLGQYGTSRKEILGQKRRQNKEILCLKSWMFFSGDLEASHECLRFKIGFYLNKFCSTKKF